MNLRLILASLLLAGSIAKPAAAEGKLVGVYTAVPPSRVLTTTDRATTATTGTGRPIRQRTTTLSERHPETGALKIVSTDTHLVNHKGEPHMLSGTAPKPKVGGLVGWSIKRMPKARDGVTTISAYSPEGGFTHKAEIPESARPKPPSHARLEKQARRLKKTNYSSYAL